MNRNYITSLLILLFSSVFCSAQTSPDGKLAVEINCENGKPTYSVYYNDILCIEKSPLGLKTNLGDFTDGLMLRSMSMVKKAEADYKLCNIKRSENHYEANYRQYTFSKGMDNVLAVTFMVSNNNIAFRYKVLPKKETLCCVIDDEATGFAMPEGTTTFMCPQMGEMTGFARTAPSYETHYDADAEMGKNGWGGGYTFPCLFKETKDGKPIWVLVSETGTVGNYCGCKLVNVKDGLYKVGFPSMKENNGYGTNNVQATLPFETPWRTITIGESLKPIVETTITWDVLAAKDPQNEVIAQIHEDISKELHGRGAWSWIIANDESCNFKTQKEYIDFAAAMGWESLLIDAQWDRQIGRDSIEVLANYGKEKGVALYLWYNSNGKWNDAPQTPRNCLDNAYERRKEMQWMKRIGIRGMKVDFFGGDKQCTMQLYHDILKDAMEYQLLVIFHGCTLPRGWEYLYPSYAASEAVRASENLHFSSGECEREAMDATFLPFLRNTVGSMDFGGSTLNWYYNPLNSKEMWGGHRVTSDVFALATSVLFQSPVQHFAMAPNNLTDAPTWAVDFMKTVPTTWQDIRFIDGYPGKYVVLARKSMEGKWYVTAVNGQKEPLKVNIPLDMFKSGQTVTMYSDDAKLQGSKKALKVSKKQQISVTIPVNGACLINE